MSVELEKPWRDLTKYIEGRLAEARYEAELALKFMEAGLYKNAAGKAIQAFKALIGALAARHRDYLARKYAGVKRLRDGRKVEYVDWLIAIVPTGLLLEISRDLSALEGVELLHYANTALNLHEFQYNGLDRSGAVSRYARLESVEDDIMALARYVIEKASK